MQRATPIKEYDVEVVTADDLWALYGPKLPDPKTKPQTTTDYRWRRWSTRVLGVLISATLHVLLMGTALLGTSGRPPLKPITEGATANSQNENATEFVSVVLLLSDHSITPPDQPPDDSAYTVPNTPEQQPKEALLLAALDTPRLPEISGSGTGTDESAPTGEAAGDEAGRAMLFGRYMGQIKARIERAWEKPNMPLAEQFNCKVQIKQNDHGDVQEVTLQRCNDDPAWQLSLVQAIQRASPLSAPPNESVFSAVLTLSFDVHAAP